MLAKPNHHNSGTWELKHFLENTSMKEMSIITLEAVNPTLRQEYLTLTHTSSGWGNHFPSFYDFSLPYIVCYCFTLSYGWTIPFLCKSQDSEQGAT